MVALVISLASLGFLALAAYSALSLRREARGLEIHAHADGTLHTHHRGSRAHVHPTMSDRYDGAMERLFGPAPGRRIVDLAMPAGQPDVSSPQA